MFKGVSSIKITYVHEESMKLRAYIYLMAPNKGPLTYCITQGDGCLLIFETKCDKKWVGCFWSVMSHFKQLKI